MAKTNLFHVQESILLANGFTKEVIDDKNGPNDEINTLRLIYFTKRFKEAFKIEVNYTYLTEDEKQYKLYSSAVEMHIDDEYCTLPIKSLSDLLTFLRILSGDE